MFRKRTLALVGATGLALFVAFGGSHQTNAASTPTTPQVTQTYGQPDTASDIEAAVAKAFAKLDFQGMIEKAVEKYMATNGYAKNATGTTPATTNPASTSNSIWNATGTTGVQTTPQTQVAGQTVVSTGGGAKAPAVSVPIGPNNQTLTPRDQTNCLPQVEAITATADSAPVYRQSGEFGNCAVKITVPTGWALETDGLVVKVNETTYQGSLLAFPAGTYDVYCENCAIYAGLEAQAHAKFCGVGRVADNLGWNLHNRNIHVSGWGDSYTAACPGGMPAVQTTTSNK